MVAVDATLYGLVHLELCLVDFRFRLRSALCAAQSF